MDADAVIANKDVYFINSLNGKVAGVNINASSAGMGGASKVVMRGTKSISQSSNALYVIDGVPMFTKAMDGGTEFASQGTTDPIADINPEDIESMSSGLISALGSVVPCEANSVPPSRAVVNIGTPSIT